MLALEPLIQTIGYTGVSAIVFAESGLLIGFFLPGDSLLFTAGLLASQGWFNIWLLAGLCFVAAVVGDNVGYAFGHRVGKRLFERPNSRFFKQEYIVRAEKYYEKYGAKTIVLARFIPVIRTFAPIVAGIGSMRYRVFLMYNIIGGVIWAIGLTVLGYWLGSQIPDIDRYLIPIVGVIILLSVVPPIMHLWKQPGYRQGLFARLRTMIRRPK